MLAMLLKPALVIHPFIGFSSSAGRTDDDIKHVAKVIRCTPTLLQVHVLNGEYNPTFDVDGLITESPEARRLGETRFLQ